jgi:NAD(P)-dependent dehydrogenase (short-subunit alcohol dehydrogenase family)
MAVPRIALVTGGNRGIGFEVCRQLAHRGFTVILGSRDRAKGEQAAAQLAQAHLLVLAHQLDVTDSASIERLRQHVATTYRHLDVLVNNAAILYDTWQDAVTADLQVVQEALDTNTFGAWRMCQAFIPLLRQSLQGRIVNVSSEAGALTSMGGGTPAYALSKAALNAITRMLAAELKETGIVWSMPCVQAGSRPIWVAPVAAPLTEEQRAWCGRPRCRRVVRVAVFPAIGKRCRGEQAIPALGVRINQKNARRASWCPCTQNLAQSARVRSSLF